MFNPAAILRLSRIRSLWPLLVLYNFNFSFLCIIQEFSMTSIITVLVYIYLRGQLKDASGYGSPRYIEDSLVAFDCLLYGRVVVALTHSPFPFSSLSIFVCRYTFFLPNSCDLHLTLFPILSNQKPTIIKLHLRIYYLHLERDSPTFWST